MKDWWIMGKVELLAPAGSWEALVAATAAGADAVYIGGSKFGARAYADNLDQDRMLEAIDFVHLHGRKLYLTVNTLLKETELEQELYDYLKPYYQRGIDGVIVQDMGVVKFIQQYFPQLPIHASTQMTITGEKGAKFLEEQGIVRAVPARELSLQEIHAICENTELEIETFVHGALCYCYSGQCLFSSMLGGRSGNRGRCAQPCRLPYQVVKGGRQLNDRNSQYALSPKDMCALELLPEIIAAGVCSLKIEGRMKKPEYTAGVVRIYRKYLDLYENDPNAYAVAPGDLKELGQIYNRDGFNRGYYHIRNGREMMALHNEKKDIMGNDVRNVRNESLFTELRKNYVQIKIQEKINGFLKLKEHEPAILELSCKETRVSVKGTVPQKAVNQPVPKERIEMQIKKTGNTPFCFEKLVVEMDKDLFIPMQGLNELRRDALTALEQRLLSGFYRNVPEPEAGNSVHKIPQTKAERAVRINALCETAEQLAVLMESPDIDGIYCSFSMLNGNHFEKSAEAMIKKILDTGKECWIALPHMIRSGQLDAYEGFFRSAVKSGISGFLVRNMESFGHLRQWGLERLARLDSSVYTWNYRSQEFWRELGIAGDTVPAELNCRELKQRDNSCSEMVIYGYQPLMVSAQCVQKNFSGCNKKSEALKLRDRYGTSFNVRSYCGFCYNVIYNSIPLGLLKERDAVMGLGCKSLRLSFTGEDAKETKRITDAYIEVYRKRKNTASGFEATKGHFRRGAE